jgi:hypothetical protein
VLKRLARDDRVAYVEVLAKRSGDAGEDDALDRKSVV